MKTRESKAPDDVSNNFDNRRATIERYEKKRDAKHIYPHQLKKELPELFEWLESILPYAEDMDDYTLIFNRNNTDEYIVFFYTENHKYTIRAKTPFLEEKGYLGCTLSNRRPLTGEDHTRGADLPDGPFHKDVFEEIKKSIIAHEVVPLEL